VFNRFFWTTVSKTVRPMLSDRCVVLSGPVLSVCPVCDICVLWPNGRMDQDETWHAGRPWPGHIVLYGEFWGDSYPSPNRHNPPIFGPYLLRPNGWRDQVPLGREVGLGPSNIVLYGDPAPPLKRGQSSTPKFSAHVYCGQTAGWIKMAFGM